MTIDDAKSLLLNISAYDVDNRYIGKQDALEMAISALELQERLLERKSYLYYKDNPTEAEKAEYYALEKLLEAENDE